MWRLLHLRSENAALKATALHLNLNGQGEPRRGLDTVEAVASALRICRAGRPRRYIQVLVRGEGIAAWSTFVVLDSCRTAINDPNDPCPSTEIQMTQDGKLNVARRLLDTVTYLFCSEAGANEETAGSNAVSRIAP